MSEQASRCRLVQQKSHLIASVFLPGHFAMSSLYWAHFDIILT